jgi:hypothetical protein
VAFFGGMVPNAATPSTQARVFTPLSTLANTAAAAAAYAVSGFGGVKEYKAQLAL